MDFKYSYNGTWKRMIDLNMRKGDLQEKLNLSPTTISKMGKGEAISLNTLAKIALLLNADIGDLVSLEKPTQK